MKKKTIASFAFVCAAIICFACGINYSAFATSETFVLLRKPTVSVDKNSAKATISILAQDTTKGISRYDYLITKTSDTTNETETVVDSKDKTITVDRPYVITEFIIEVPNLEAGYTYNFHGLKFTDESKENITEIPGEATFVSSKYSAVTNTFTTNVGSNLIVTQVPTVAVDQQNKKLTISVTATDDIAGFGDVSINYKTIDEDGTERLFYVLGGQVSCYSPTQTEAVCIDEEVRSPRTITESINMQEGLTYEVAAIVIQSEYGSYSYRFTGTVRASLADGIIENTLALADETGDDTGSDTGTGANDNNPTDGNDDVVDKANQNTATSNDKVSNPNTFDGTFVSAGVLIVSLATAFVAVSKFSRR